MTLGTNEDLAVSEARWNEMYIKQDVAGFSALLDDDFRYLSEQGEFDKNAYVENLMSGAIDMRELTTISNQTRIFDDVAIVTGRVRCLRLFGARISAGPIAIPAFGDIPTEAGER